MGFIKRRIEKKIESLKNYRDRARKVKKDLQEKRKIYFRDGNLDFKSWFGDLKEARKELLEIKRQEKENYEKLTETEKKRVKEIGNLWLEIIYFGLQVAARFTPIGPSANLVLRLISLVRLYRK